MTTGLRNSAESVAKRVAKLTSGVSSKLDKAKTIDKGTRMDIASRVKKMREIVDGFDKLSSERLKGLEERDRKRRERAAADKAKPRRKTRSKNGTPKSSPRPHATEAPVVVYAPRAHIEAPVRAPPPSPQPRMQEYAQPRGPPRPSQLIVSRDIAPPPPQASPGTASKIMSFLPA